MHSNICELNGHLTRRSKRYFIAFIDDSSRLTYVYLIKIKDEVFLKFKKYKFVVKNQLDRKVKILRSDREGDYFLTKFDNYCEEHGLIHQKGSPYHNKMV